MTTSATARKQKQLNECLLWAADRNEVKKLKYYLSEGATVDKTDPYRRTSLMKAIQHGSLDAFESLIAHGASVHKSDVEEETPLTHASYKGCFDILCRLVELGSNINHKNKNDETPVYISSKYGHYDCVRRLVIVGADYTVKSKFRKTALDVAMESLSKVRRQKREDKYQEYENIIEFLNNTADIEVLRKQEKMFSLTPEEFRCCLERSQYRQSDVNVRIVGLNDDSIMAVARALIRQLTFSPDHGDISNGICILSGFCDINIETGEWITHTKISERDLVFRQMGEVVKHYVNTHRFDEEIQNEKRLRQNKQSHLFRSNTVFTPSTNLEPFTLSSVPNILNRSASTALLLPRYETNVSTSELLSLPRSKTATSLFSLKSERSEVSLSGMNLSFEASDNVESAEDDGIESLPSTRSTSVKVTRLLKSAKKQCSKAVQTVKEKVDSLINGETTDVENVTGRIIKDRKQVYDTFECVKSTMHKDNSNLAAVSVCALSSKFDFALVHRHLFTKDAIYIFVVDSNTMLDRPYDNQREGGYQFTNREYIEYLVHEIWQRNRSKEASRIVFLSLNTGESDQFSSESGKNILQYLSSVMLNTEAGQNVIIDKDVEYTLEELYTEKIGYLTSHISDLARKAVQARSPNPATWLPLQESLIAARENNPAIIARKDLIEICVNKTKTVASPSRKDVDDFINYEAKQGCLLQLPLDGNMYFICLEIAILYQLLIFFSHVTINLTRRLHESASLLEKLKTVSNNTINKTLTKCYLSVSDPLIVATCSLYFIATNVDRRFNDLEMLDLIVPVSLSTVAPESVVIQFHRLEYSPCFCFKLKNSLHVITSFQLMTSALFEIWPLKKIHGKDIIYENFVAFSVDNFHILSVFADGSRIIFHVTRNNMENSNTWYSKIDVCNNIFTITKHCMTHIFNDDVLSQNPKATFQVEVNTCSQSPPCWVDYDEMQLFDSYSCPKHNVFVDPKGICELWRSSQVCPMKAVDECSQLCKGLSAHELLETATDFDFSRIIRRMSLSSRKKLLSSLKLELHIQPSYSSELNIDQQLLFYLIKWRNSVKRPNLGDLQKLLLNSGEQKHILCKMSRHAELKLVNMDICKNEIETPLTSQKILHQLAVRLISRSMFLSIELGLDFVEYNHILHQTRNNPFKTTKNILLLHQDKSLTTFLQIFQEIGVDLPNLTEIAMFIVQNQN